MSCKQNRTTFRCIAVYGVLVLFLSFLGCDLIEQLFVPVDAGADPGGRLEAVKIGFIHSPPDPGTTQKGAELAVALRNGEGGIDRLPIELLIRDDRLDPLLGVQHANELIDAGVLAIVGPEYSVVALEVGKIAQQRGIPMITTYSTNPEVTRSGNFCFMGAFIDPYQAKVMAQFAIEDLEATTAAVLTERGENYSETLSTDFIKQFTALGGTIAAHEFYQKGTTDFTDQLKVIDAVEPPVDVVFLPAFGAEFPLAVKQAKSPAFGMTSIFLGGDGWDRPDLVEIGGTAVEGSFFTNHFSADAPPEQLSEAASQFITAYTARFGIAPDGPASLGYDSTRVVIRAMRRSINLTPAAIRDEIEATQNYDGAAMLSHFDENRHAIKSLVINTVRGGKIQFHQILLPSGDASSL